MSRHKNFRGKKFDEGEYDDGYDDYNYDYPPSYEGENFIEEAKQTNLNTPDLNQVLLDSCCHDLESKVGGVFLQTQIKDAILNANYDNEIALNNLLTKHDATQNLPKAFNSPMLKNGIPLFTKHKLPSIKNFDSPKLPSFTSKNNFDISKSVLQKKSLLNIKDFQNKTFKIKAPSQIIQLGQKNEGNNVNENSAIIKRHLNYRKVAFLGVHDIENNISMLYTPPETPLQKPHLSFPILMDSNFVISQPSLLYNTSHLILPELNISLHKNMEKYSYTDPTSNYKSSHLNCNNSTILHTPKNANNNSTTSTISPNQLTCSRKTATTPQSKIKSSALKSMTSKTPKTISEVNGAPCDQLSSRLDDLTIKNGSENSINIENLQLINGKETTEYEMDPKDWDTLQTIVRERQASGDNVINVITLGHVDAGKSTLMGHLLYLCGGVGQKLMHKNENESKKLGKGSFAYAWVLDETGEERSRGITMDITQRLLKLKHKTINLIDSPGHKDFIPNMITGASQADAAILVIDATRGEFETGFLSGGQTREHAVLARSLGISQLIVAINKMDNVAWNPERFETIRAKLAPFLKTAGFARDKCQYVPVSGLLGLNIEKEPPANVFTDEGLSLVHQTGTLLHCLDLLQIPERKINAPLRFIIHDFYKSPIGSGTCLVGHLETGYINVTKTIKSQLDAKYVVLPANEIVTLKSIRYESTNEEATSQLVGNSSDWALAGDHVTITIQGGPELPNKLTTQGQVMCPVNFPTPLVTCLEAKILVFDFSSTTNSVTADTTGPFHNSSQKYTYFKKGLNQGTTLDISSLASFSTANNWQPITLGFQAVYHYESFAEPCAITKLIATIDKATGKYVTATTVGSQPQTELGLKPKIKKPRVINRGESAVCEISFTRPICIETFSTGACKELGRFTLRQFGRSICAGIVTKIIRC